MNQKLVSAIDAEGYFAGAVVADGSPREPGVYLLPAGAVDSPPPHEPEGMRAKWVLGAWLLEEINPPVVDVPQPTPEEIQAQIVQATQSRLDAWASTRNYDGILSACTYVASSVPKFAAEGQAAVNARDATWSALYAVLADVQSGARPMPSSFADVEPLLPALEWPL